ncbi:MAG: tRNA lysidine(34) synthetase TilS [Gammaproteobacteria bacterium]|nr:tRNA lysidine(34) synthetase TilS [Gammaproteobacteria bacterium]
MAFSIDFSPPLTADVWIAYSGGLDSTVLLHRLVQLRREQHFSLKAIHIHHGLNTQADAWQMHCQNTCQEWQVQCITHKINLSQETGNIEARARTLRYAHFSSLLKENDILCTAHHQDDQAETFLLQLVRGAGPKGLSAMPAKVDLGQGKLQRPILQIQRDELLDYAIQHGLSWVDDESNQETRFSRNFIRHKILPILKQRWPSVTETMARSSQHCAESEALLNEYGSQLTTSCVNQDGRLRVSRLKSLTVIQQKLVLRYWLTEQHCCLPSDAQLRNALHIFLKAADDKNPMMRWENIEMRRYRDELYIMHQAHFHDAQQVLSWKNLSEPLVISSLGLTLSVTKKLGDGINAAFSESWEIRFRQQNPALKKRFQYWGIPAWERSRIPLLYIENELAAVLGYQINKKFRPKKNEEGLYIRASRTD